MKKHLISPVILVLASLSCGPLPDLRDLTDLDAYPPVLLTLEVTGEQQLRIAFDEACTFIEPPVIVPGLETVDLVYDDTGVVITFSAAQEPGKQYTLDGSVRDERGNSTDFIVHFYGYNPDVPLMVINEFTPRGSSTHPDLVELRALTAGNTAGMCFYEGTSLDWDHRYVLPPLEVKENSFILLHIKPQGISEEIDETLETDTSGGYDCHPEAFDLWVTGGTGLSGNNGVLSLYASPYGDLKDGVLYSNRTSSSDTTYRGFGMLKVLQRAEELHRLAGWTAAGELIAPEDAVNPEGSTATRSICRRSTSEDTNTAADWHIVPTGGYTFGEENNDQVYTP
ncbi:MAG: hypothetical protein JW760_10100 [Spirochaetales bacterium]|nr:hypothetical protein [Spirochaetales bacterium]